MGGAWHAGSLYVASPPHIWKFTDTNHDGVADQRVPLVGKFGYTGNAASIHGCFSGPDGRLYWCDGYHGHEFQDASGQIVSQREGSYIFSCRPDGSDVRLHCGGGMDNPVEVDFTETGEVLGTVNILYTQPRVDAFVHWLHGGAYPHRERVLAEIKTTGELLGPVHPFGHVAVSGTMRYRSGAMDHRWRDNYFATFFNSGRVVRLELERRGASFAAVQREFLSSASSEFHPTDVVEDADGSLLVVDTGGWFYRGCPTSQFAKPDILGGIYRVRRTGMTSVVDPRGLRIDWSKQSNSQLAAWLGDTRFAVREQAISQCVARGSSMIPILADILTKPNHVQRLGALWALTRLAGNENDSSTPNSPAQTDSLESTRRLAIRSALQDPHQLVRQAACHSLATYPDEQALEHLIELLDNDAQPAIRRQAATALGRLGDEQAVPHLLSACRHAVDRTEQHAIIYALIEANKPTSTRAGLTDVDPTARRAALIALDQMAASNLTVSEVLQQLTSADPTLKNDIAVLFSRHSEWSGQAVHVLRALLRDGAAENSQLPDALKRLIAQSLEQESVRELLGQVLADPQSQPQHVNWILEAIAAGNKLPCHASWTDPLKALLDSPDSRLLEAALRAIAALDTDSFSAKVNTLADDALRSTSQRVFASQVAARNLTQLSEAAFELLIETLMQAGPVESLRAAELLSANGLSKTQLLTLAPMLSQAGPSQIQTLLRTFQRSNDPEVGKAFLNSLEQARALSVISPPAFSDIIKRYPTELLPQANAILAQLRQSELDKLSKLDPLMSSLATADVERGRELFFSEKAKCGACHRVDQQGTNIGPDLSTIGFNRTQRDLLESILFPTATIVRDYEAYSIVTVDGLVVNGLIKRETLDAITVQPAAGDPVEIARDDIDQMSPSNVSIMPNGLDEVLGPAEIADIVAYLMSRRG
jgi:putative heme-binding domain-containing protein